MEFGHAYFVCVNVFSLSGKKKNVKYKLQIGKSVVL